MHRILLLASVATAILLGVLFFKTANEWGPSKDAQRYEIVSRNFAEGKGLGLAGTPEFVFSPGYPLLLSPFVAAGLNSPAATVFLIWPAFLAFLAIVYYGISRRYDALTGAATVFAVTTSGALWVGVLDAVAEILMLPFLAGGVVAMHSRKARLQLVAGVSFGFAYLIKPEAAAFALASIIFMLLLEKINRNWRAVLRLTLPLFVTAVAYASVIYLGTGTFTISGKTGLIQTAQWVENPGYTYDAETYRLNPDMTIGIKPGQADLASIDWPKRIWFNLIALDQLLSVILFPAGLVLAALVISLAKLPAIRRDGLLFVILLSPLGIGVLLFYQQRYLLPVVLLVTILLSMSVAGFLKHKQKKIKSLAALPLVALLSLNAFSLFKIDDYLVPAISTRAYVDEISPMLARYDTVVSRTPTYSYIFKKDYSPIPYSQDVNKGLQYLRSLDKPVLVLDEWATKPNPMIDHLRRKYGLANTTKAVFDPMSGKLTKVGRVHEQVVPYPSYRKDIRQRQGL